MQEIGRKKRKQAEPGSSPTTKMEEPFPEFIHPTPEECRAVRDDLLAHHGFPQEFVKYQRKQQHPRPPKTNTDNGGGPHESESVLDGLVSTILSQNTTDSNSRRAFLSLKSIFPSWEHVSPHSHSHSALQCFLFVCLFDELQYPHFVVY